MNGFVNISTLINEETLHSVWLEKLWIVRIYFVVFLFSLFHTFDVFLQLSSFETDRLRCFHVTCQGEKMILISNGDDTMNLNVGHSYFKKMHMFQSLCGNFLGFLWFSVYWIETTFYSIYSKNPVEILSRL